MALQELGISPEELMEAAQSGGLGGGAPDAAAGGMPPEAAAGGLPPEMAPKMAAAKKANDLYAVGSAVANFKRAGKFQIKEARTKRSRHLRDIMKQHVIELVTR
jgi:hypothetical protein